MTSIEIEENENGWDINHLDKIIVNKTWPLPDVVQIAWEFYWNWKCVFAS